MLENKNGLNILMRSIKKMTAKIRSTPDLKQKFLDDPSEFLVQLGYNPPRNIELKGYCNDKKIIYFVIPALPNNSEINNDEVFSIIAAGNVQTASSAGTITTASTIGSYLSTLGSVGCVACLGSAGTSGK